MNIKITRSVMIGGLLLLAGCATTGRPMVFIMGDTAYVNGQRMPLAQYEEMKKNGTVEQFANSRGFFPGAGGAAPVAGAPGVVAPVASVPLPAGAVRTATCRTTHLYDEFPGDDEKFSCTSGLGELTRPQIVSQGWRIDLTEKLPAPGNALSARGLPLSAYKLVLSR